MAEEVIVAGVGMTSFYRPSEGANYVSLVEEATNAAIIDADISFSDFQQAFLGWAYGDTTSGQRALLGVGMSGIPVFNVNNACASGSSAAYLARQCIKSGEAECVLALGFEQMPSGALELFFDDRPGVLDRHVAVSDQLLGASSDPMTPKVFAAAGREHMMRDGITTADYAKIAVKARKHAALNPRAIYRSAISVDEVLASNAIVDPLTKLQCCPPSSGAAAAVFCSTAFARRKGITNRSVRIKGMSLVTDTLDSFNGGAIAMVGAGISRSAAENAYTESGVTPSDVDVVELHDCFTINEALSYESLLLADDGDAAKMIADEDNTYGGAVVVNPSGGLLSKGHPLGATGVAQLAELTWQLRGEGGARQVSDARIALQHNVGLNGAAVVTVLESMAGEST